MTDLDKIEAVPLLAEELDICRRAKKVFEEFRHIGESLPKHAKTTYLPNKKTAVGTATDDGQKLKYPRQGQHGL